MPLPLSAPKAAAQAVAPVQMPDVAEFVKPVEEFSPLRAILNFANRPLSAVMGTAEDLVGGEPGFSPLKRIYEGLSGEKQKFASDVIGAIAPEFAKEHPYITAGAGLPFDMLLDPITWATFGFGSAATLPARAGASAVRLSKVGARALRVAKEAEAANLVRQGVTDLPTVMARATETAELATRQAIDQGAAHYIDRGGIKLSVPFSEHGVIGRHLPAGEISLLSRGPVAEGANLAGAAVDKGFENIFGGIGAVGKAVGESAPVRTFKKLFGHSTGMPTVDAAAQKAKGMGNIVGEQLNKLAVEFVKELNAMGLVQREKDVIGAVVELRIPMERAAELHGVTITPKIQKAAARYKRWTEETQAIERENSVKVLELGEGIRARVADINQQIEKKTAELATAKAKKLHGITKNIEKKLAIKAGLEASMKEQAARVEKYPDALTFEGLLGASKNMGQTTERLQGRAASLAEEALNAQERAARYAEELAPGRTGTPAVHPLPEAAVAPKAGAKPEPVAYYKKGDAVNVTAEFKKDNFRGKVIEPPNAEHPNSVWVRHPNGSKVAVDAERAHRPAGAQAVREAAAARAASGLSAQDQTFEKSYHANVTNWLHTAAEAGDEGAGHFARQIQEANYGLGAKGAGKKAAEILHSPEFGEYAAREFGADTGTIEGRAAISKIMAHDLGILPGAKPGPVSKEIWAEMVQQRKGLQQAADAATSKAKLAGAEAQAAVRQGEHLNEATIKKFGGKAPEPPMPGQGYTATAREQGWEERRLHEMESSHAKVSQEVERVQRVYHALSIDELPDKELAKLRRPLETLAKQRASLEESLSKVPGYSPLVLTKFGRRALKDVLRTIKSLIPEAKMWTDKDVFQQARNLALDKNGAPIFTTAEINRMASDPAFLESMKSTLHPSSYGKLKVLSDDYAPLLKRLAEEDAKTVAGRLKALVPQGNLVSRWLYRSQPEQVAKLFETDPVRIITARNAAVVKAVRGATFYDSILQLGSDIVQPVGKTKLPGWMDFDEIIQEAENVTRELKIDPVHGWKEFPSLQALKGYQFQPDVAKELARTIGRMSNDEGINEAVKVFDTVQGFWKEWLLVAPAYIIRNIGGNVFNSVWYGKTRVEAMMDAFRVLRGKDISILGQKFSAAEVEKLAKEWNVWEGGQYGVEGMKLLTPQELERGPVGKAMDYLPNLTFRLNKTVETHARLSHFISKLQDGMSPGEASMDVVKYLFDYSAATPFEEKFATRAMMFYRWYRNNMALQVGQMFHEPWRVLTPFRASQELANREDKPADLQQIQPPYLNQMLGAYLGRDSVTGDVRILTQFGLPAEDLLRLDPDGLASQLSPFLKIPVETLTGQKIGMGGGKIEEYQKAYAFLRVLPEPIKDAIDFHEVVYPNGQVSYKMNPWKLYVLMNTPFSRIATQVGKATEPGVPLDEKALALLTGVRIARFNETAARAKTLNTAIMTGLQASATSGKVGTFSRYFLRKEAGPVSPETARLLEAQGQMAKYAKQQAKARKAGEAKTQSVK